MAREVRARASILPGMILEEIRPNPKVAGMLNLTCKRAARHCALAGKGRRDIPLEVLGSDPRLVKSKHDRIA